MSILDGIAVGEYGRNIGVTCVDDHDIAVDVSTFTLVEFTFTLFEGTETIALTGGFLTTGVNGKVVAAFTPALTPATAGMWRGQVILTKPGVRVLSEPFFTQVWEKV